jgi:hypothetical protein
MVKEHYQSHSTKLGLPYYPNWVKMQQKRESFPDE